MIIATAGHIDHGKTALVEALTGVNTDRLPEEKARGMSIDLGFAYSSAPEGPSLGFVDVPGHERFVRNMVAGVSGIDFALLVVAADDGIMPQTKEHLAILDLLGIKRGAVALTKIDVVDAVRVRDLKIKITQLLERTSLTNIPVFQVSSTKKLGISALRNHLQDVARSCQKSSSPKYFRLAVDRCFVLSGAGLVATGTVYSGQIKVGDKLVLSPEGFEVRVRSIHAQNRKSQAGIEGQRLGLNISGSDLNKTRIGRGSWLLDKHIHVPTQRCDALIRVVTSEIKSLKHWARVHVHLGTAETTGRIALLECKSIPPGGSGLVQLILDNEIGALHGDRLVLRDASASRTIGGGYIIDPFAPTRGRSKPGRISQLRAMDHEDPIKAFAALLAVSPFGIDIGRFQTMWNLRPAEAMASLEGIPVVKIGPENSPKAFDPTLWQKLRQRILTTLEQYHESHPAQSGLTVESLRCQVDRRIAPVLFRSFCRRLVANKDLILDREIVRLPGHRPVVTPNDKELWKRIRNVLDDGGPLPPTVHRLAEDLEIETKTLLSLLRRMERVGIITWLEKDRFCKWDTLENLAAVAEALVAEASENQFTVAAFRERSGIGRNLTIKILEFFDELGFTKRVGNSRRIIRPAKELLCRRAKDPSRNSMVDLE